MVSALLVQQIEDLSGCQSKEDSRCGAFFGAAQVGSDDGVLLGRWLAQGSRAQTTTHRSAQERAHGMTRTSADYSSQERVLANALFTSRDRMAPMVASLCGKTDNCASLATVRRAPRTARSSTRD